ncbi:MAG TPA: hypothetical protein PK500_03450 [Candidatus Egerieousia sp.]|mgnify:CR=1 FL=1|nr:hypothetical protein [Candidatus Egerieousia sp.]HPT05696.1 hypothetical protein [Candidatus Egerieousia sp.]
MSIGNNKSFKTVEDIRDIIKNNESDIAFVIGNGANLYCREVYKEQNLDSWDELLSKLWSEDNDKEILDLKDIKSGISYTELFDIIELNKWEKYITEEKRNFLDSFKKINLRVSPLLSSIEQQAHQMQLLSSKGNTTSNINVLTQNVSLDIFNDPRLNYVEKQIADLCRNKLSSYGVDTENLSDEECNFKYLYQLNLDSYLKKTLTCDIKFNIAKQMKKWGSNEIIKRLVSSIKKLDSPILTTNFDDIFSKSIGAEFHVMQRPSANSKFTDWYPWNCYYGDDLYSPTSGFGIWHINGMVKYPRSILLGLCDYMRGLDRARGMIQGLSVFNCDDFSGKNEICWRGCDTWLHCVFNKSLFIFGLTLDENEVFLRWLLIQRKKYFSAYGKPHKGWYIAGPKDTISNGKRLFLESFGFEIIHIKDYKIIYEDIWSH